MSMVLILAIVAVNEAGFYVKEQEVAAIHWVLTQRAYKTGRTYEEAARAYAPSAFRLHGPRRWVVQLDASLSEPDGFPRQLSWRSKYLHRWQWVLAAARRVAAGGVVAACRADHWGIADGPHYEAVRRRGWRRVCARMGFENAFWRIR